MDHDFECCSFGVKHLRPICTLGISVAGTLPPSTKEHDPIATLGTMLLNRLSASQIPTPNLHMQIAYCSLLRENGPLCLPAVRARTRTDTAAGVFQQELLHVNSETHLSAELSRRNLFHRNCRPCWWKFKTKK